MCCCSGIQVGCRVDPAHKVRPGLWAASKRCSSAALATGSQGTCRPTGRFLGAVTPFRCQAGRLCGRLLTENAVKQEKAEECGPGRTANRRTARDGGMRAGAAGALLRQRGSGPSRRAGAASVPELRPVPEGVPEQTGFRCGLLLVTASLRLEL